MSQSSEAIYEAEFMLYLRGDVWLESKIRVPITRLHHYQMYLLTSMSLTVECLARPYVQEKSLSTLKTSYTEHRRDLRSEVDRDKPW